MTCAFFPVNIDRLDFCIKSHIAHISSSYFKRLAVTIPAEIHFMRRQAMISILINDYNFVQFHFHFIFLFSDGNSPSLYHFMCSSWHYEIGIRVGGFSPPLFIACYFFAIAANAAMMVSIFAFKASISACADLRLVFLFITSPLSAYTVNTWEIPRPP